jgi:hypothetical protein
LIVRKAKEANMSFEDAVVINSSATGLNLLDSALLELDFLSSQLNLISGEEGIAAMQAISKDCQNSVLCSLSASVERVRKLAFAALEHLGDSRPLPAKAA